MDGRLEAMTLTPGTRLARYEIRAKIDEGGMGEVYLAEDTRLHRKVVLKILPDELADKKDRMRRFEQEAQAAAALNHPNIAHIYEIGEEAGTHYIAMEFIDGVRARLGRWQSCRWRISPAIRSRTTLLME